jgi:hypothetical protein
MNIDNAYPSKFMKASDLPDETIVPFIIEDVRMEEVGRDKSIKPIIYFKDQDKGFCCNKTNANTIKKMLGSGDTEDWVGKTIRLYSTEVQFGDEMVESIRVSIKTAKNGTKETSSIPF